MAIPSRYREGIAELGGGHIVVTCSPMERALWLYPLDNWQDLEQTILGLPSLNTTVQKLRKFLIGHAHDCEIDGSGRILLPGSLRDYALLHKDVSLVGQLNRFEIWSTEYWDAKRDELLAEDLLSQPLPVELESVTF